MAWLSRVNFVSSDTLSFTDINNLGNDIRAWGDNVNGGGYTLSNVVLSASSGTMATVTGGTGTTSTLTLRSTSGVGTTGADIIFQAGNNGATEVMRLQNGGNVGIGLASPATILDVGYTTATDGFISFTSGSLSRIRLGYQISATPTSNVIQAQIFADGVGNLNISSRTNNASGIIFYTNSATTASERMRIDSSGNVLIGYTTSNGSYLLQVNSQIFATNATIATSDGRYKENISPIKSGLDVVGKLNPVSFTWTQHEIHNFDSGTQVGFIAQDVQAALVDEPYLESVVKRNEVELKDGTKEEFYGLSDAKLIPILVKAIQELKAEIDILKARN